WLTGIPRRARGCPALHPWRDPCRRVSGDGMRVEPSLMHPEGGSWTEVRTHTPSKFSKVLHEPLAPIPLERSKFRENGSQPPPNRTGGFHRIRLSTFGRSPQGASVSISVAFIDVHLCLIPFPQHALVVLRRNSSRVLWVLCSPFTFVLHTPKG